MCVDIVKALRSSFCKDIISNGDRFGGTKKKCDRQFKIVEEEAQDCASSIFITICVGRGKVKKWDAQLSRRNRDQDGQQGEERHIVSNVLGNQRKI